MGNGQVIIVEDDISLARILAAYLEKSDFSIDIVSSGADLFKSLDARAYDGLIIDLGLPDQDGIVLVRKVRARSQVPIIVLTGRDRIEDKLICFELGVDDYIVKPVDPRELKVRLQLALRRVQDKSQNSERIRIGPVTLDYARRSVVKDKGEVIDLTPAEFMTLWVLANSDGKAVSRDDLVDAISAGDGPVSVRAVDILISRLRKKIDKKAIITVSKVGYRCGWEASEEI